jgi:flagellar protein FliO/FliZ
MRRPEFLPIVAAMLLLAAACNRSDAQDNTGFYPSAGNAAQTSSPTRVRTAAQPAERTATESPEPLAEAHHKSWRDLVHSKADGKSDKQVLTFSPWSAFGALAVVVGLILVLARLFRRHAPNFSQSLPQEALEILGRRHVDPRQTILLVRIGARILVVGSSASGLNPLGQIDDPVEVDLLAGLCRRGSQAGVWSTSFFRLLKGETKTRPGTNSVRTVPQSTHPSARSVTDFRAAMQPLGSSTEDLSQPEHDLIRRLRGTTASVHAEATEDVP